MAFGAEGEAGPGKASPGGGDCLLGGRGPEGDSPSIDRAHDSGPSGPLPVAMGYGVNGSVVTGHDALVTVETLRGSPHKALWGGKGVGSQVRSLWLWQGLHDPSQGTRSSFSYLDHLLSPPSTDIQCDPRR